MAGGTSWTPRGDFHAMDCTDMVSAVLLSSTDCTAGPGCGDGAGQGKQGGGLLHQGQVHTPAGLLLGRRGDISDVVSCPVL